MNLKKMTGALALTALAMVTGFSIGKVYVDSASISMISVEATEEDLRDSDSEIQQLVARVQSGETVDSFTAIELFQIAENNLSNSDCFLKEMIGTTNSASVELGIKSQRIKVGDTLAYYKLSPAKTVAIVTTPNIASRTIYKYSSPNQITISTGDSSCFLNTSSAQNFDVIFSSAENETLTSKQYLATYKTTPDSSLMPYIISSKTCTDANCSEVTDNGNGTYSFTFSFNGNSECAYPALYYTYEILTTCGYSNPSLQWNSLSFTVTIDDNFNFVSVSYLENYKLSASDLPMSLSSVTVVDTFDEKFYYDEAIILQRAVSDFSEVVS